MVSGEGTKQNLNFVEMYARFTASEAKNPKYSKSEKIDGKLLDNLYLKISTVINMSEMRENFGKYLTLYVETRVVF